MIVLHGSLMQDTPATDVPLPAVSAGHVLTRSNVEATNSMIGRAYGGKLPSTSQTWQINEALCMDAPDRPARRRS